jgi:hypothetical protein
MAIGPGCRREHPNQHCLLLLRVLHTFRLRMRTPKGTPKGVKWPSVTFGSHDTTTKKNTRGKKWGMRRTYFPSGHFWTGPIPDSVSSGQVTDVTSGQKAPLGRIWRNFRLRMRSTYFRTGHLTHFRSRDWRHFGHVTSGSTSQHLRK